MPFSNGLNITQLAMEAVDRRVVDDGNEANLTLVQVVSEVVQELETQREENEAEYEQFLADVWVGVVLTLMVLSCVCCMCSCLLYHKFQQWKRRVLEQRAAASRDHPDFRGDTESLPSYTLVSGLPSYDEALEQLKQVQAIRRGVVDHVVIHDCGKQVEADNSTSQNPVCPGTGAAAATNSFTQNNHYPQNNQMTRLSVAELLQIYKIQQQQQQQQLIQQQQQSPPPPQTHNNNQQLQQQQQQIVGTIHLHRGIVKT